MTCDECEWILLNSSDLVPDDNKGLFGEERLEGDLELVDRQVS